MRGGVDLYIKNNVPYVERQDLVADDLEIICIEVNRMHSKPFLIGTWYRPPNSDIDIFNEFELCFFKCDTEVKKKILLGDLNCDFSKVSQDFCTRKLQALCSLYDQLTQVINEPTRLTETIYIFTY
jgi:hypothetical protein